MANYKTQAINLKSYNLGESDKIVSMYSRDHGIIRGIAKGVRKPTSKFGGRMEMLVANKLFLAKGKKLDIICQVESVDNFKAIRQDITKLTHSIYCAELINTFGLENDPNSSKIYDIFFESLKNISLSTASEDILWTTIRFQLRLMQQLGYAVELNTCVKCNALMTDNPQEQQVFLFCAESGGIICNSCGTSPYKNIEVNQGILKIFKDAINFDFPENSAYYNGAINQVTLNSCFNILKEYIALRSHKKLKTPELIESLC